MCLYPDPVFLGKRESRIGRQASHRWVCLCVSKVIYCVTEVSSTVTEVTVAQWDGGGRKAP
jgi:hypothetical protein